MTELRVPPGTVKRLEDGWSVRWSPTSKTTKKALFVEITDDGVLELEHIRTIRTSCRDTGRDTDPDADPCEVPEVFLAVLRDRGCKPAHVRNTGSSNGGVGA